MKYRVYNDNNWNARMGQYMATYFKTKREAVDFQTRLGGKVQRKIGCEWYNC